MEQKYFNRDLSWLTFNELVMEQMCDKKLPIFERLKFLAIYSSNLDEFYRVRVAYNRSLLDLSDKNLSKLYFPPQEILDKINAKVEDLRKIYEDEYYKVILPELQEIGIYFVDENIEFETHQNFINDFFSIDLMPEIQPVMLSTSGAVMSFLKDNEIYLAIKMWRKNTPREKANYAVIQVPKQPLGRFIKLPTVGEKHYYMFLEDIIRCFLPKIFPGYEIEGSFCLKLSRNADLNIEDEFSGDLLAKLRKSLKQRKTGVPSRFAYDREMPQDFMDVLKLAFNITEKDFSPVGRYLGLSDFFGFQNPYSPLYEIPKIKHLRHSFLDKYESIFKAIDDREFLLHFPYHTYDYVLRFFNEAAIDPYVQEIKTTQYRVATNSAIVNALKTAARNGKKVTVFVEVKARFDEAANIRFADEMKEAGIHVITGLPGLKVHAKAALVTQKGKNKAQTYAFLSTGNFNEKTATQYSDLGFFTSDERITKDLETLFLYLETPNESCYTFQNILVPRFNMIEQFKQKIKREIKHAEEGREAYIILKMNGLGDLELIDMLYDAAGKGVKIDLIVRGICKLRPGMSFSPNIRITRIVDRFLEHARIYTFSNDNHWEVYIASADLLTRNIRRRVETCIPIYQPELKQELVNILKIQLRDNTKSKFLDKNINNISKVRKKDEPAFRAQKDTYTYLQNKEQQNIENL